MAQRFAAHDRVVAIDAQAAAVPIGTLGTVVQTFARVPEICDVVFDTYADVHAVSTDAIAPAPSSDSTPPPA